MERARRYQRTLSVLAFGVLALSAEVIGRSLTRRVDLGRHIASPSYSGSNYYPFLLAGLKVAIAIVLARLCWRVIRAHASERAARGLLGALGRRPRFHLALSPRLALAFFAVPAVVFLIQIHAEGTGPTGLLGPWLHSSALPVFAVLGVACALVWAAVQRWLAAYEEYAERAVAQALRHAGRAEPRPPRPALVASVPPRRLFGLSFESRPPPLAA